jgi:hypothetical protein
MNHKRRRVDYNCHAGRQFNYVCDVCSLDLHGFDNKNVVQSANGWTWELTLNGVEIASAGNDLVRSYGGTEEKALEDGLKRFDEEPCIKPN